MTENSEEGVYNGLKQMLSNTELLNYYHKQAIIRSSKFSKLETVKAVENMFDTL